MKPSGTHFNKIWIKTQNFFQNHLFKNTCKMACILFRPQYVKINVRTLMHYGSCRAWHISRLFQALGGGWCPNLCLLAISVFPLSCRAWHISRLFQALGGGWYPNLCLLAISVFPLSCRAWHISRLFQALGGGWCPNLCLLAISVFPLSCRAWHISRLFQALGGGWCPNLCLLTISVIPLSCRAWHISRLFQALGGGWCPNLCLLAISVFPLWRNNFIIKTHCTVFGSWFLFQYKDHCSRYRHFNRKTIIPEMKVLGPSYLCNGNSNNGP